MAIYGTSFIYDDISSDDYNLLLCGIGDEGEEEIDMGLNIEPVTSESGRPWQMDYGIRYSNPLSFSMVVAHKDGTPFTYRQIRDIAAWLAGRRQPHWLRIFREGDDDICYCCRATEIYKRKIGGTVIGLGILFTCNSSYAFSEEIVKNFEISESGKNFEIYADSDAEEDIKPLITAKMKSENLKIENLTTGQKLELKNFLQGDEITIDNFNQIILINQSYKTLGEDFNLGWLSLRRGTNELRAEGIGTLAFRYRNFWKGGDI